MFMNPIGTVQYFLNVTGVSEQLKLSLKHVADSVSKVEEVAKNRRPRSPLNSKDGFDFVAGTKREARRHASVKSYLTARDEDERDVIEFEWNLSGAVRKAQEVQSIEFADFVRGYGIHLSSWKRSRGCTEEEQEEIIQFRRKEEQEEEEKIFEFQGIEGEEEEEERPNRLRVSSKPDFSGLKRRREEESVPISNDEEEEEQEEEQEEEEEEVDEKEPIKFSERSDTDGLFDAFKEGFGPVLVVCFEKERYAFFSKEVRAEDGALRQKIDGQKEYKQFMKGKKGFVEGKFAFKKLADAKAFARNPNPVLELRKAKAKATAAAKANATTAAKPRSNQTRKPTNNESFWCETKKPVYDLIPLPGAGVVASNTRQVSLAFDGVPCDARAKEPSKNLRRQEIKHNCKTYSCRVTISTPEQREGLNPKP
ncbi:unnamed protein product [Bathycoccus prasinos]